MPSRLLVLAALAGLFLAPDVTFAQPSADGRRAGGPIFRPADDAVEWIVTAQAKACSVAQVATGAELDGLDVALRRMMEEQDRRVRQLVADSAPIREAQRVIATDKPRLDRLETQLGPLHAERNRINAAQAPYEERMAAVRTGPLKEVNEAVRSMTDHRSRLQQALRDFYKANPNPGFLEGRHEQLGASIKQASDSIARLEARQLQLLRDVLRDHLDPAYEQLRREEAANDEKINELERQIGPLRERVQAAKDRLKDADLEGLEKLEQLHELNGFMEQYLSRARSCVEDRRKALASGAPTTPTTPTTPPGGRAAGGLESAYLSGRWRADCSGLPATVTARADSGDMNFTFERTVGDLSQPGGYIEVLVGFITTGKVIGIDFGARGHVVGDGTITEGRGGASFYTLAWDGKIVPDLARSTAGSLVPDKWNASGNVRITDLYTTGGGTCIGTWTATTP